MTSIGVSQIVSFIFRRLVWSLGIVRSDKIYVREHHFYDHQHLVLQKQMEKENGYSMLHSTSYGKSSARKVFLTTVVKTKVTESIGKHMYT
jgi:hypothetical protein